MLTYETVFFWAFLYQCITCVFPKVLKQISFSLKMASQAKGSYHAVDVLVRPVCVLLIRISVWYFFVWRLNIIFGFGIYRFGLNLGEDSSFIPYNSSVVNFSRTFAHKYQNSR